MPGKDGAAAPVAAAAWSVYLPGTRPAAEVARWLGPLKGGWGEAESPPPENAAAVLGRKGLLSREPATRLALCAVHRALGLPPGRRPAPVPAPRTAVVACGNLGNAATVSDVARTVAAEGGRGVSVLDAPNVSGNVLAGTVALWFGFGGPNLMVCSGAAAGLDGLVLAARLLRAGRADKVVLVGAEPADEDAAALHAAGRERPLRAGAACLVLVPAGTAPPGGVLIEPRTGPEPTGPEPTGPEPTGPASAGPARGPRPDAVTVGPGGFDPAVHWGDAYGAGGVVSLALAAHLAADESVPAVEVRHEAPGSRSARVVPAAGEAPS
ncbi:beta-ketoacyl synthase N-terminal-like domain-containing protein [Actinomadura sediminis]|uniref:Beta-ketoacyl synthase N-terminal-like domain-containing protein n=1 Tax=Actinomadura sediminis TaxID=1038904 RepID=A0ABW3EJ38_9ACTN